MTRKTPVSAFGSEIMDALLRAAKSELRIHFPSMDMAMRFRQRIYQLRAAMRGEKHIDYPIAASVRIYVERKDAFGSTPASVIVRLAPADSEFSEILRSAGIVPRTAAASGSVTIADDTSKFEKLLREIERPNEGR